MKLIRSYKTRLVEGGFTMIELVMCLGIISFALVAIIGVLPVGINVQKDNREAVSYTHLTLPTIYSV